MVSELRACYLIIWSELTPINTKLRSNMAGHGGHKGPMEATNNIFFFLLAVPLRVKVVSLGDFFSNAH